jgi:DNA repair exonuclease SbcCD ATPase subunit
MRIKNLYAENVYSYEKMEFKFDNFPGGTTLILGKNLDRKSSNGAGKSSIMKALYFCLYGEDVAKANKGDVVRRGASKGYYLNLEFEDRGHDFRIERFEGRKDKSSSGKGLNFYIDGELFNGVKKEGAKGEAGAEETQKIINQKIKISSRLFLSSVYAAQDSKKNFLTESDTDKKELLSELLDLQIYAKAFKFTKEAIDEIERRKLDKENKILGLQEQIKTLADEVINLVSQRDKFSTDNKEKLKKEELKLNEISKKLSIIRDNKRIYNLSKITEQLTVLTLEKENVELELKAEPEIKHAYEKIKSSIEDLNTSIEKINKDITTLIEDNTALDLIDYNESAHDAVKTGNISLEKDIKVLEDLKEEFNKLKIEINNVDNQISNYKDKIKSLENEIKTLENSENCPTCLRPYEKEHLVHVQNSIESLVKEKGANESNLLSLESQSRGLVSKQESMENQLESLESLKEALKEGNEKSKSFSILAEKFKIKNEQKQKNLEKVESYNKEILEKKNKISTYEKNKKSVDKLAEELIPFKNRILEINNIIPQLNKDNIAAQIEENDIKTIAENKSKLEVEEQDLKQSILEIKRSPNPYTALITRMETRSTEFLDKIDEFNIKITQDVEQLRYYGFWALGFAPTGVRSFITDDVIDLLNKSVQDNLNDLFDGALSVFFDPESKNNKGIVSNKISTNFFLNGKETAYESLSGGEKRRAILATQLALTEIAESRSGNKLNIRFLDEPFDGIDSHGQLQAFKLFSRLSKDKDGFFVISHDESFQSMCSNVVYVVNKNEISKIVDKASYNGVNISTDELSHGNLSQPTGLDETGKTKQEILAEKIKQLSQKNKNEPEK